MAWDEADKVDAAIANVLAAGLRTADILGDASSTVFNGADGRRHPG
jgi:isocitrate/isopropylmalate dehydrogenase